LRGQDNVEVLTGPYQASGVTKASSG